MRVNRFGEVLKLMGPAFLVSVAYLDPGNWATAIEGGSKFGYQLIWVVVLSNLIAILLQTLAARLGLVTGKHLAEVCREQYPVLVCVLLWVLCEISIIALDLTMVLGTAVGLNLLFRLPILPCLILTSLDAVMVLLMVPRKGVRWPELLTVMLVGLVLLCFLVDVFLSAPPLKAVVGGLWPTLERDSIYTAVSLLGANVMPHNFYLHSALVKGRGNEGRSITAMCHYNFIDVTCALGIALVINLAVLIVSASTFYSAGVVVETLQDAHDLMEQLLSSSLAPAVFGLALLFAGQLSTFTGTISGQVVLKGFLNVEISPWLRRLLTRTAAVVPAAIFHQMYGDKGIYRILVIAQVILALQLPFTLVPLIKATSEKRLMGQYVNTPLVQFLSWGATLLIFMANLMLFVSMLLPPEDREVASFAKAGKEAEHRNWTDFSEDFQMWLDQTTELAWHSPMRLAILILLMIFASASLALLLWMLVTPLSHTSSGQSRIPFFGKAGYVARKSSKPRELNWIAESSATQGGDLEEWELMDEDQSLLKEIVTEGIVSKVHRVRELHHADQTILQVETKPEKPNAEGLALSRGSRRQIAITMDTFWSQHYDLHGRQTPPQKISADGFAIRKCMEDIWHLDQHGHCFRSHSDPPWAGIDSQVEDICSMSDRGGESGLTGKTRREEKANKDNELFIFGLWCLVRVLEMCKVEPRPELWGKYASVLNRLQWLLPKCRERVTYNCEGDVKVGLVELLRDVEGWVQEKKGPKGTAAGNVAFPKGKEIIMSVVKRYRRSLIGNNGPNSGRRTRILAVSGAAFAGFLFGIFTVLNLGWPQSAGLSQD